MSQAPADLGPVLPSRASLELMAREMQALATRAVEFAGTGPTAEYALAVKQFERMRALLSQPDLLRSPGEELPRKQDYADAMCDITPDLGRAIARLQAWVDSQHSPPAYRSAGPPIYYSDVRAVLAAVPFVGSRNQAELELDEALEELRRTRNDPFSSTFHGRTRTEEAQRRVTRARTALAALKQGSG